MKNKCKEHDKVIAPFGPALFIQKDDYRTANELQLTYNEMSMMSTGRMAMRHFEHDTWCENRAIAWF